MDPDEATAHKKWLRMQEVGDVGNDSSFAALAEAWLQEHESLISADKFPQIASYIARFAKEQEGRLAKDITKGELLGWIRKKHPGRLRKDGSRGEPKYWGRTTQGDAARAIKRVYQWAFTEGKIARNQFANLRIPQGEPRRTLITLEQHRQCLAAASPSFRLYLIASRCGARPRQIREVTAENVFTMPDGRMIWVFQRHKKDEGGKQLVVYLSPCLATLTKILVASRRKFLFLNSDGNQWKKDTVSMTMRRLRNRVGIQAVTVYAYRHSFATDALLAGNSLAVVAELLGHADTRMVGRVYGHLDQQKGHLLDAVQKTASSRISQGSETQP